MRGGSRILFPGVLATVLVLGVASAQAAPGDLDTSFGTGGKVTTSFGSHYDEVDGLALQPDGKIVAGGYVETSSTDSDFGLARYNPNGSLDATFGSVGKVTTAFGSGFDYVSGIVLQPDGKIVAAGRAVVGGVRQFGLARYNADGSLDTGFGTGGKVTTAIGTFSTARGLALQPDGKIVAVGYNLEGSSGVFALARYNTDGSPDTSFGTGGVVTTSFGGPDDFAYMVALQPDGKIVVAGDHFDDSRNSFALARYNTNGSLDTSFGTEGKVITAFGPSYDACRDVAVQADGKIVAVGYSRDGANNAFALARYNADGSLDTSFNGSGKVTTGFPGTTWAVPLAGAIQPNGRIVAAGYVRISGPAYVFALARYNTNGTLDTSFGTNGTLTTAIGAYDDYIVDIVLQPDGKIVAGGSSQPTADANNADFALTRYLGDSHTLTVSKRGSGKGTVASTPVGIDCGSACSAQFADAGSVTLTATPKSGSVLSGWSGGCSGTKKACTVAMSAERSVKAEFSRCVVPKVKGKPLAKAKRAIKKAHCSVGRVKKSFSRKVRKGRVSAQKPKPGAKRSAGAKVSLTVSKGRRR